MDTPYSIDIQIAYKEEIPVPQSKLFHWIQVALEAHRPAAEITLRLVDKPEITELNTTYRQKNKPTNVLAFPADIPDYIDLDYPFLGDIIVCPMVLEEECKELGITQEAHWAHILIHGVLHLLGYDHIDDHDAIKMQSMEIKLLADCGFNDPYNIED